jgi:hypothetical protein
MVFPHNEILRNLLTSKTGYVEIALPLGFGINLVFLNTLSIILVVSGLPIGGLVCLSKCCIDVVDCSCESAGQSLYGPRIGFLRHFNPWRYKTSSCTTEESGLSDPSNQQSFCLEKP